MSQPSTNLLSFGIRSIDSQDLAHNPSASMYPSISNITYDFVDNSVSANCTSPLSNTTSACIMGAFNLNDYISFNLTDLRSNTTTSLHAVNKIWVSHEEAPSALLKDNDGAEVIRTDVTKNGDCTQLKVCAAQDNGVGITIPIGLILARQMEYAMSCTAPSSVSVTISVGPLEIGTG